MVQQPESGKDALPNIDIDSYIFLESTFKGSEVSARVRLPEIERGQPDSFPDRRVQKAINGR